MKKKEGGVKYLNDILYWLYAEMIIYWIYWIKVNFTLKIGFHLASGKFRITYMAHILFI